MYMHAIHSHSKSRGLLEGEGKRYVFTHTLLHTHSYEYIHVNIHRQNTYRYIYMDAIHPHNKRNGRVGGEGTRCTCECVFKHTYSHTSTNTHTKCKLTAKAMGFSGGEGMSPPVVKKNPMSQKMISTRTKIRTSPLDDDFTWF